MKAASAKTLKCAKAAPKKVFEQRILSYKNMNISTVPSLFRISKSFLKLLKSLKDI